MTSAPRAPSGLPTTRPRAAKPRLASGLVAGVAGTLAMDLLRYRRQRRRDDPGPFSQWEISAGRMHSFDEAGAPAEVGRRTAEAVGIDLPPRLAGLTQDTVHWATGISWALVARSLVASRGAAPLAAGLGTGVLAFAAAYTVLGWAGIYRPIWTYDLKSLSDDLTGHLAYGATTGVALALAPQVRFAPGMPGNRH